MFWLAIIGLGVSFAFIKLGALSVWVGILAAGIKLALLVISSLVVVLIWKMTFGSKS
ncbi:hypothetical protein [Rhodoferax saidenbachensis]|uniref:Uncharacterized protein n=1 Tax=Rhodoferax saidenbachensis TaxID=1484693 RepID=A0ABU1ZQZ7_9BURK|nr:hypothetical protein [Rhodoferax saidenbachensis]MDR7307950.1 hypothetical protein [Rhodoferax saidenbachensis]